MNTTNVVMAKVSQSTFWKSGATGLGAGMSAAGAFAEDAAEVFGFGSDFLGPSGFGDSALMQ